MDALTSADEIDRLGQPLCRNTHAALDSDEQGTVQRFMCRVSNALNLTRQFPELQRHGVNTLSEGLDASNRLLGIKRAQRAYCENVVPAAAQLASTGIEAFQARQAAV